MLGVSSAFSGAGESREIIVSEDSFPRSRLMELDGALIPSGMIPIKPFAMTQDRKNAIGNKDYVIRILAVILHDKAPRLGLTALAYLKHKYRQ